jgi:ABC-type cobalamin/Fe3+-siderophores transport system ATPase subunit
MEFEVTIKNYRCFPDSYPARITIGDGFIALIGVNNSGKSSLLRFFYELRTLFYTIANDPNAVGAALRNDARQANFGPSVSDPNEIFNNANDRDINIELHILRGRNGEEPAQGQPRQMQVLVRRATKSWTAELPDYLNSAEVNQVTIDGNYRLRVQSGKAADLSLLRDAFKMVSQTLYVGPFRNAINVGGSQDYYDIKVGQAFISDWHTHKTGPNIRQNEAIIRLTDDIRRIFEFERLEIDASSDNNNLKIFVNNKSFKLTELGAGLTQFILVLANAAIRNPSLILIDEPETNLHPSLQIDFLTTLASYCRGSVIFGTHSIGLARAVGNRIYSLRRIAEGQSEVRDYEATPHLPEFLGELGFSGYQELGYDKILLVEGPTDVTTFQQFLRIYCKDHKIVILPLGGRSFITAASVPQLAELKRITPNIVAVIDSERQTAGAAIDSDRQAFVDECRRIGIDCRVLERRATENYFTDSAVKTAKGPSFAALGPYEVLSDHSPSWHKRENWRIAREMAAGDLDVTDLGQVLNSI